MRICARFARARCARRPRANSCRQPSTHAQNASTSARWPRRSRLQRALSEGGRSNRTRPSPSTFRPTSAVRIALMAPALGGLRRFLAAADGARSRSERDGPDGVATYRAMLTNPRYLSQPRLDASCCRAAVTVATLVHLGHRRLFLHAQPISRPRASLLALLTFPLAFPGVVVGFMVIMLAGRQGLIGEVAQAHRRHAGVRLLDGRPFPRLPVLLDPARDPHRDGRRRRSSIRSSRKPRDRSAPRRGACTSRRHLAGAVARPYLGGRDLLRDRDGRLRHRVHARDATSTCCR